MQEWKELFDSYRKGEITAEQLKTFCNMMSPTPSTSCYAITSLDNSVAGHQGSGVSFTIPPNIPVARQQPENNRNVANGAFGEDGGGKQPAKVSHGPGSSGVPAPTASPNTTQFAVQQRQESNNPPIVDRVALGITPSYIRD